MVYLLRQVENFATSTIDKIMAQDITKSIDDKLSIDIKDTGIIKRFNGMVTG